MLGSRNPVSAIFPSPEILFFMMRNNSKFMKHALLAFCLYSKILERNNFQRDKIGFGS